MIQFLPKTVWVFLVLLILPGCSEEQDSEEVTADQDFPTAVSVPQEVVLQPSPDPRPDPAEPPPDELRDESVEDPEPNLGRVQTDPEGVETTFEVEPDEAFNEFATSEDPIAASPSAQDDPIYCRLESPWPFGEWEKPYLETPVHGPVGRIQDALNLEVDGVFGTGTEAAIQDWQRRNSVPVSGCINARMMRALAPELPIPDFQRRAFHLTYLFEGTDYHEIEFNWSGGGGTLDGQGLTWGPTGMTLASGEIRQILALALSRDAEAIEDTVGSTRFRLLQSVSSVNTEDGMRLVRRNVFDASRAARREFKDAVGRMAALASVRNAYDEISNRSVESKLNQYLDYLRSFEGITELDWAMFYDISVQTGRTQRKINALRSAVSPGQYSSIPQRRQAWGQVISSQVNSRWRENREDRNRAYYSEDALAGNYGLREREIQL